jgi:hypothetical protein
MRGLKLTELGGEGMLPASMSFDERGGYALVVKPWSLFSHNSAFVAIITAFL